MHLFSSSVDGGWSDWQNGTCSATCGGGVMNRTRQCDNPAPVGDGQDCDGESEETVECNTDDCPGKPNAIRNKEASNPTQKVKI